MESGKYDQNILNEMLKNLFKIKMEIKKQRILKKWIHVQAEHKTMKITNQEFLGLLRVNFSSVKAGITSPYASNGCYKD